MPRFFGGFHWFSEGFKTALAQTGFHQRGLAHEPGDRRLVPERDPDEFLAESRICYAIGQVEVADFLHIAQRMRRDECCGVLTVLGSDVNGTDEPIA